MTAGVEGTEWADGADVGLLSPVRVGTPVEAAVSDTAWLQAMLDAEAALARAQACLGEVPTDAAAAITRAARAELLDVRALAVAARESANPVVAFVPAFTAVVAERAPEAAQYVHRGSTSQDVLDTATALVATRALRLVRADLDRAVRALGLLAAEHRDTVAAARTLGMHALPTTFGLRVAGWRELLTDADERLDRVADGRLPVSLGGAAGTLAGYLGHDADPGAVGAVEAVVSAVARETGLAVPVLPWHTRRTPFADLAHALAGAAVALGKIATDVLGMARTEVGEVREPGGGTRGTSSAMPQKRNPVLATLVRSAALQVPGLAAIVVQCGVAEDERPAGAWHAEWQPLRECLRLTGGAAHAAAELVEGLEVFPDRMRDNLARTGGAIVAERVAAALSPVLGRVGAKQAVSAACAEAQRSGRALPDVLADRLADVPGADLAALADLCDPAGYLGGAVGMTDRAVGRAVNHAGLRPG